MRRAVTPMDVDTARGHLLQRARARAALSRIRRGEPIPGIDSLDPWVAGVPSAGCFLEGRGRHYLRTAILRSHAALGVIALHGPRNDVISSSSLGEKRLNLLRQSEEPEPISGTHQDLCGRIDDDGPVSSGNGNNRDPETLPNPRIAQGLIGKPSQLQGDLPDHGKPRLPGNLGREAEPMASRKRVT